MSAKIYLFSYGSNHPDQLKERIGRKVKTFGAYAENMARIFVGHSERWNGGVASLDKQHGKTVFGLIAEVTSDDLDTLDLYEGVLSGKYKRQKIKVKNQEGKSIDAIAYIAVTKKRSKPSNKYLEAVAKTIGTHWKDSEGQPVKPSQIKTDNPKKSLFKYNNPVLTEGQIKNSLAMFQWLIDKEIESVDLYKNRIKQIADETETIEQFDVILRLNLISDYINTIAARYTYHYAMDIPVPLLWEMHKKVTELIIKNWAVDSDQIHSWRQLNVDYGEFSNRLNQSISKLLAIQRQYIRPAIDQLIHYIDLMKNQPEAWKKLKSVRWGHKRIGKLLDELQEKHDEINRENAKKGIISQPKPHEDFLKINDKLKWVFIKDRFCPYEKEGMGHCATARQGCYLLSLRELSDVGNLIGGEKRKFEKPIWVPRVTATVCEVNDGFLVTEILGPNNEAPNKKWEGAIYKLYMDDRIVEQESRTSKTYSPEKLPAKKQVKLFDKKPKLESEEGRIKRLLSRGSYQDIVEVLQQELTNAFPSLRETWRNISLVGDEIVLFHDKDAVNFFEKLESLTMGKNASKNLQNLLHAYTDPYDFSERHLNFGYLSYRDIQSEKYLSSMSNSQLSKSMGISDQSEIEEEMIPDELKDIMVRAEESGWVSGYISSLGNNVYQILKDIQFKDYDGNPTFSVDHVDKIWWLSGKASDVKKSVVKMLSERSVEFLFDENNIRDIHDIRVPDDFDEEAAVSYFQDLVTEEYGK